MTAIYDPNMPDDTISILHASSASPTWSHPHLPLLVQKPAGSVQCQFVARPPTAHTLPGLIPGADAAQSVGCFHVAGAHGQRSRDGFLSGEIAQQRGEQTGNRRIPRAGGAHHLRLETRSP